MRIDLNAKMPDLPESKSASRQAPAGRVPAAEPGLSDEATLAGHSRVRELQRQTQQLPEDGQDRIEALAGAIRAGQYNVSPEKVAQSLLSEMAARSALAR
jgi:flagellar biosynthesis anti-sigma factor FlgM